MIQLDGYDFIDFGCGGGGSIEFANKRLGGRRGIGLDADPKKVQRAQSNGYDAVVMDVTTLGQAGKAVNFVTMMHFLEHLPGQRMAEKCLRSACAVARHFIFIRQPYFDGDAYLFENGLKFYWSDWIGHTYHMTSLEMHSILQRVADDGLLSRFAIYPHTPIENSESRDIHPITSSTDQYEWSDEHNNPKPKVEFTRPVFRELITLIAIDNLERIDFLEKEIKIPYKLYDSLRPNAVRPFTMS